MVLAYEGLEVREGGSFFPHPEFGNQWTFAKAQSYEPRKQTPKLIFTGTEDQDTKEGVPDFYVKRDEIAKSLGQQSIVVQGGQHDLIALNLKLDPSPKNKDRIEMVYSTIGNFVKEIATAFKPPVWPTFKHPFDTVKNL